MWYKRLQENYEYDFETFQGCDETWGLHQRLGFESAEDAWDADPFIQGSTNPEDFKVVTDLSTILKLVKAKIIEVRDIDTLPIYLDKGFEDILDILDAVK